MKILVVDDELPARESMERSLIKFGYTDILKAKDGFEALDIINNKEPAIILADIRMPGMDGLSLMEKLQAKKNKPLFIFISGYDLFDYALKALRLGAFNYLLKPVRDDELEAVMKSAENTVHQQNRHAEEELLTKIELNKSLHYLRRKFISQIIMQKEINTNYIREKSAELDINFEGGRYCVILADIDPPFSTASSSLKEKELLVFSIEKIISDIVNEYTIDHYFFETTETTGCLLHLSENSSAEEYVNIQQICSRIIRYIENFLHITVTVGIGRIIESPACLNDSYETAQKSVMIRALKGGNNVYCICKANPDAKTETVIDSKVESEYLTSFERCDVSSTHLVIDHIYAVYKGPGVSDAAGLMKLNLQYILLLYKAARQTGLNPEALLGDEFLLYEKSKTLAGIDNIISFMKEQTDICLDTLAQNRKKGSRKALDIAKEYILDNLHSDLSLDSVSEYVHISPSHLSRLFRQELGQSFIDFVIESRINKAKELLKQGIYKANEVARLTGFNDEKHFYKTFKKNTGFTPNEYKEL